MKKLLVIVACVGALALAGCGGNESPEAFGKNYVEKKFEKLNCNLAGLEYTIQETGEDTATVHIEGNIKYKEEINLVKEDGEWTLGKKGAKKAAASKDEKKEAPAKEEKAASHEAPAASH